MYKYEVENNQSRPAFWVETTERQISTCTLCRNGAEFSLFLLRPCSHLASRLLACPLSSFSCSSFFSPLSFSLSNSVFLSVYLAPPHMHFNVTSWRPPGSQSDGRASCMELLEAQAPQATSVMEVSRNHRGWEAKKKRLSFPLSKVTVVTSCKAFVKFNGTK